MVQTLTLLVACVCIGASWSKPFSNPLHASCMVDWTIGRTCTETSQKLVDQIKKWSGDDCDNGEKCLYELVSSDPITLKAKHTTPKQHYVDDLTFIFRSSGSTCLVHGTSTSETWYAVLDYGTNYCNMHNLITGAGLDTYPSYIEKTNDFICTQYSSADCNKY